MTTALVWLLVVLVGGRLRLRPLRRRPGAPGDERPGRTEARRRCLPRSPIRVTPTRRAVAESHHVATWCDDLARAVRGGSTLAGAIGEVEPPAACTDAVEQIRLAQRRGLALRQACDIDPCPPHLDVALTVIRACAANGGPAAEPLSRTAATLRARAADAAERRTQSAQARMSATVMTVLPVCMLVLLLATSGSVRAFATAPAGIGVITIGMGLNVLGWRWMRRLIDGGRR